MVKSTQDHYVSRDRLCHFHCLFHPGRVAIFGEECMYVTTKSEQLQIENTICGYVCGKLVAGT
jgi:hypothetical protein